MANSWLAHWTAPRRVQPPQTAEGGRPIRIFVIHTPNENSTPAIRAVEALASELNAEIVLLAALEVPFPLPLTRPAVSLAFTKALLRNMIELSHAPARVELHLCRDRWQTIRLALPPNALVVLGGRRWFGRGPRRLAALLAQDGHNVLNLGDFKTS